VQEFPDLDVGRSPAALGISCLRALSLLARLVLRAGTGGLNESNEKTTRRSRRRRGVKVRDSRGKIKAPEVVASVIYADEISANTVEADTIYVRELDRH